MQRNLDANFLGILSRHKLFWITWKTCSDKILSKLTRGVATALVSSRRLKNFETEKIFFCSEITEIEREGQFWVGENDSGQKCHFLRMTPFSVGKYSNSMTCSLCESGILVT